MDLSLSGTPLAGYTIAPQTSQLLDELISRTIGVFILGTFASLILYGICIIQFYGYVRMYRVDTTSIKLLVLVVMVLETVHTAFSIHACYFYLVSNYSDAIAATHGVWSIEFIPTLQAIITLVSQAFFARRVSLIGPRHQALAIFAFVLLVGSLVLAILMTVDAAHARSWYLFFDQTQWITSCGLLLAGVADFVLSSAIIVGIRRSRAALPRPGSTRFDVVKLYVVNTGLLTGVVHAGSAIMAIIWPSRLVWAALSLVAIKLYSITFLTVLNSRGNLNSRGIEIFDTASCGRNIIARANHLAAVERWNAPAVPDDVPPTIRVQVSAQTEVYGRGEGKHTGSDSLKSLPLVPE